jgi:hypothetical protein
MILQNGRNLRRCKCRSSEKLGQVFMLEKDMALGPFWFSVPITQANTLMPRHLKTRASNPVPFSSICRAPAEKI